MLIGIYLERSLEMCIGLLGILKAGGAYVPLDTAHPQERLAFMLEDTKLPVILTRKQLLGSLPKHSAEVVCLDSDWEIIASESAENPAPVRRSCATREPKHKDSQSTKFKVRRDSQSTKKFPPPGSHASRRKCEDLEH